MTKNEQKTWRQSQHRHPGCVTYYVTHPRTSEFAERCGEAAWFFRQNLHKMTFRWCFVNTYFTRLHKVRIYFFVGIADLLMRWNFFIDIFCTYDKYIYIYLGNYESKVTVCLLTKNMKNMTYEYCTN